MSRYIRPRASGASIFFTAALHDRSARLLVEEVDRLRWAVAKTRMERPFAIDAFVVLPDHLHCVWTLPAGDADYSTRWRLIKARFSQGFGPVSRRDATLRRQDRGVRRRRFREHHLRSESDLAAHIG